MARAERRVHGQRLRRGPARPSAIYLGRASETHGRRHHLDACGGGLNSPERRDDGHLPRSTQSYPLQLRPCKSGLRGCNSNAGAAAVATRGSRVGTQLATKPDRAQPTQSGLTDFLCAATL